MSKILYVLDENNINSCNDIYDGEINDFHQPHGNGTMNYSDGSVFTGIWANGCRVHGTYIWCNGDKYIGFWRNNKLHCIESDNEGNNSNLCTIESHDGKVFKGYISEGEALKGELTYNGNKYKGKFMNGQFHDENGILIFRSGLVYEGEFLNGLFIFGKITYPNKNEYFGHVRIGLPNTHKFEGEEHLYLKKTDCIFTYKNSKGNKIGFYKGEWLEGKRHGKGIYEYNGLVYKGYFKDNEFESGVIEKTKKINDVDIKYIKSKGSDTSDKLIYPEGKYIGEVVDYVRQGKGVMAYNDNKIESGFWKDDKLIDGNSTITIDNIKFVKVIKDSQLQVEYIEYKNGDKYIGSTKNNMRHGQGILKCTIKNIPIDEVELFSVDNIHLKYSRNQLAYMKDLVFEGEWENNKLKNGKVTFNILDIYYETKVINKVYDKNFNITLYDGFKYTGEIRKFYLNGQGIATNFNTRKEGEWKDNELYNGTEIIIIDDEKSVQSLYYNGNKVDVTIHYQDGKKYKGEMLNNNPHGKGVMEYQTIINCAFGTFDEEIEDSYDDKEMQPVYDGMWYDGKRHGEGTMKYSNSYTFTGNWHKNERIDGELLCPNHGLYKCEFELNILKKYEKICSNKRKREENTDVL